MARTTDDLLNSVKISCTMPSNQVLLTDDRILALAQEEMELRIIPSVINTNQNYMVRFEQVPVVFGQESYAIPYRALGRTLRELKIQDGSQQIRNLALISLEDAHFFNYQATPNSFYFMEDRIILVPNPQSNTLMLNIYYLLRLGRLTQTLNCAQVTAIDTMTNSINVSVVPSNMQVGSLIDFIQGRDGNSLLAYDQPIVNIAGTTITFASLPQTIPYVLSVGDWIAPADTTPVLMVPEEAFSLLQSLTSYRCLMAIGDQQAAQAVMGDVNEKIRMFEMMISPRIEGEPIKIINRISLLRGNRSRIRRGIVYP
jgi:hypothetical protein